MANYKKYVTNLIGDWEKDIYAPQSQVVQDVYQTNWNKLSNDYADLKNKLARNFNLARQEYANTLNDVQNTSFNRMNAANIDLANRGLSSSGITNLVQQSDTQAKGEDIDKALTSLLNTNRSGIEDLSEGVNTLGQKQTALMGDLASDLGGLTDADAANMQQYANLAANIEESAAQRASSRSGGGSSSKAEKDDEDFYRTLGIITTLNDDSLSDDEKRQQLVSFDLDTNTAIEAINSRKNNKLLDTTTKNIRNLEKNLKNSANFQNKLDKFGAEDDLNWVLSRFPTTINDIYSTMAQSRLNNQRNKISGLTYTDLNELLFGKK